MKNNILMISGIIFVIIVFSIVVRLVKIAIDDRVKENWWCIIFVIMFFMVIGIRTIKDLNSLRKIKRTLK
jgi:O-antigen ligase